VAKAVLARRRLVLQLDIASRLRVQKEVRSHRLTWLRTTAACHTTGAGCGTIAGMGLMRILLVGVGTPAIASVVELFWVWEFGYGIVECLKNRVQERADEKARQQRHSIEVEESESGSYQVVE